ncbi:hypothetical protein D3C81_1236570 [compost metagenome]
MKAQASPTTKKMMRAVATLASIAELMEVCYQLGNNMQTKKVTVAIDCFYCFGNSNRQKKTRQVVAGRLRRGKGYCDSSFFVSSVMDARPFSMISRHSLVDAICLESVTRVRIVCCP